MVWGATVTSACWAALGIYLRGFLGELGSAGGGRSRPSDGGQSGALVDRGSPGRVGGAVVGDVDVCEGTGAGSGGARSCVADEVKRLAPVTGAAGFLALLNRPLNILVVVPNDACGGDRIVVHAAGAVLDELPLSPEARVVLSAGETVVARIRHKTHEHVTTSRRERVRLKAIVGDIASDMPE